MATLEQNAGLTHFGQVLAEVEKKYPTVKWGNLSETGFLTEGEAELVDMAKRDPNIFVEDQKYIKKTLPNIPHAVATRLWIDNKGAPDGFEEELHQELREAAIKDYQRAQSEESPSI